MVAITKRAVALPTATFSSSASWLKLSLCVAALGGGGLPGLPRNPGASSLVVGAVDLPSSVGEGSNDHPRASPDALLRHYRPFSFGWMKGLVTDKTGCSDWRTVGYAWRPEAGFASNMNSES